MVFILVFWYCTIWLLIKASSFHRLCQDQLRLISSNISNQDKITQFRLIDPRCNHVIQPIIRNLQLFEQLLTQLQHTTCDTTTQRIIRQIGTIHRSQCLQEQYAFTMPKLIHKWHQSQNINKSVTHALATELSISLVPIELDDRYQELHDIAKSLIETSRSIALHHTFGSSSANHSDINCKKLIYLHCWEYLSNIELLPPYKSVFYVEDHHYLSHLMTHFGLHVIHPNYIYSEWTDIHLITYVIQHDILRFMMEIDDDMDSDLVFMFEVKWMVKLVRDMNSQYIQQLRDAHHQDVHLFVSRLHDVVSYLCATDPLHQDWLLILLMELKRLHALDLLRWNHFLNTYLCDGYPDKLTSLSKLLVYVLLSVDEVTAVNIMTGNVIAHSVCLWKTRNYIGAVQEMVHLSRNVVFDKDFIHKLLLINKMTIRSDAYLVRVLVNVVINAKGEANQNSTVRAGTETLLRILELVNHHSSLS
eukprot:870437_1